LIIAVISLVAFLITTSKVRESENKQQAIAAKEIGQQPLETFAR
jgi:hypothetical protein